jgi:hypothetical protein
MDRHVFPCMPKSGTPNREAKVLSVAWASQWDGRNIPPTDRSTSTDLNCTNGTHLTASNEPSNALIPAGKKKERSYSFLDFPTHASSIASQPHNVLRGDMHAWKSFASYNVRSHISHAQAHSVTVAHFLLLFSFSLEHSWKLAGIGRPRLLFYLAREKSACVGLDRSTIRGTYVHASHFHFFKNLVWTKNFVLISS